MSDYDILQRTVTILTAFKISFLVIATIFLIVAIVLFFRFKIPNVISEVSGKKKQKQLEQMRAAKQVEISNSFEISHGYVQENNNDNNVPKKRNGTVSKEDQSSKKRRETGLAENKRQTTVMDKNKDQAPKKQHLTTVMDKKSKDLKKYNTLEEMVVVHSDEIIE